MIDVMGLGTVLVDQQVVLRAYPEADTKVPVQKYRQQVGGPVPTALVQLARFGKQCSFIGTWGDDAFGQYVRDDLRAERIRLDHSIEQANGSTGFAHVWVDAETGSRTIAYCRGGVDPLMSQDVPKELACGVLVLDGWSGEAAIAAAERVKSRGGRVFLDAGAPKEGTLALLPFVDVMNAPERFASQFSLTRDVTDEAQVARILLEQGVGAIVFTKGSRGASYHAANERFDQRAFPIDAVDTTGAGDIFSGGIVFGLLEGWSPRKLVRFAAATAALKCQQLGNRDALPNLDEVERFLADNA